MDGRKIHFSFEEGKDHVEPFARALITAIGQTPIDAADVIVTIGGDGQLLQALRLAQHGQRVCGFVPPGSNSVGFWTNHGVESADQLLAMLDRDHGFDIRPLRGLVGFADGSSVERHGYNDISVRSVAKGLAPELRERFALSDIDESVQSLKLALKASFTEAATIPFEVTGTGLIFATAFGSTAMNRSYDGPSMDIRQSGIILTGMGTSAPAGGFNSVVNAGDTVFDIDVLSPNKRPVMMTFDSFALSCNAQQSPIAHLRIENAKDRTVRLLLNDDPGRRAYSALVAQN